MKDITIDDIEDVLRHVLDTHHRSPWFDTESAATYLSSTPGTLRVWRSLGTGPRYHTVGNKLVRYNIADLDAFIHARRRRWCSTPTTGPSLCSKAPAAAASTTT